MIKSTNKQFKKNKNNKSPLILTRQQADPEPLITTYSVRKRVAWSCNGVGSVAAPFTVTNKMIFDACLAIATAATTATQAFQTMKIHKVSAWAPATGTTLAVVSVEFPSVNSGISGPSKRKLDIALGADQVAYVAKKPPKDSSQAFWQVTNSNGFVQFVLPAGSLVEIDFSAEFNDSSTTVAVTPALVGATVACTYQLGLDGVAASTTKFPPVGYETA